MSGRAVHAGALQEAVHRGAAVPGAVRGADGARVEQGGQEVVRVEGVGLPAEQREVEVPPRGEVHVLGPGRHLAQAHDDTDAGEVVAQPRRHAERLEEVGARRARDGEGRLEALGDAGGGEEAARRVAVEDQLAGPRVVAEEGRRQGGVGGLGVAGEDLAHEALAVDGAGQRPADARVCERRPLVVDGEVDEAEAGLRVEGERRARRAAGPPGPGRSPRRRPPRRRRGPARGPPRRRNGGRRAAAGEGRRPSARRRPTSSTRPGRAESRRNGPVPTGSSLPGPARRLGLCMAKKGWESVERRAAFGRSSVIWTRWGPTRSARPGKARSRRRCSRLRDDGVRVEGGAVLEAHVLAQGERPDALVGAGPGRGEDALGAERAGPDADERLAHAGHDLRRHDVGGLVRLEAGGVGEGAHDEGVRRHGREQGGEEKGRQRGRRAPW